MAPVEGFQATDTCARCGLRRSTRTLEERGITIRLCDDCFWGREPPVADEAGPDAKSDRRPMVRRPQAA